jgi:hypothetical protein
MTDNSVRELPWAAIRVNKVMLLTVAAKELL